MSLKTWLPTAVALCILAILYGNLNSGPWLGRHGWSRFSKNDPKPDFMNEGLGHHLLVEVWGADMETLNDSQFLERSMIAACEAGKLTVINSKFHAFSPHGVTGVILLSESHMSIHTWPEHGYAALDIFSCGVDPRNALYALEDLIPAAKYEVKETPRGVIPV